MLDTEQAPPGRRNASPRSCALRIGLAFDMSSAASRPLALVAQRLHGALARARLFEIAIVPDARLQAGVDRASRRIALALAGNALAIRLTFSIARGRAMR